jgi:heat shock protein HslJ
LVAFHGAVTKQEDKAIRFKAARTITTCLDGMDTEQQFLKALQAASSFKLSGDELELYDNLKLLARALSCLAQVAAT